VTVSEVGRGGQAVDVLHGGDVNPDGRLMSVAELQGAFRALQRGWLAPGHHPAHAPASSSNQSARAVDALAAPAPTPLVDPADDDGETGHGWDRHPGAGAPYLGSRPDAGVPGVQLDQRWIAVVAAHAGAGASTVALAVADAAAAEGRVTHLVETAHPSRSGLVAAATAELGVDESGTWRQGARRGVAEVTIDRRASELPPDSWPLKAGSSHPVLVVVDLGLSTALDAIRSSRARVAVVCRPTVPGVRLVEQVLTALGDQPVVVAAVGPSRWPGAVNASQGPRLRALRSANAVVTVAWDRHLEVTGATNSALPKPVTVAGRAVLRLLDAAYPDDAITTSAPSAAPRGKGTRR
jgi:hypothetical protein